MTMTMVVTSYDDDDDCDDGDDCRRGGGTLSCESVLYLCSCDS